MAYITSFIYSEETRHESIPNGQRVNLINPLIVFTPSFVPGQFSFAITVGLMEVELNKPHVFRYIFRGSNPEQPPIADTGDTQIPTQENTKDLPFEMQGLFVGFDLRNVVLSDNGKYYSEVFLDGQSLGTFPIFVKGLNSDAKA